MMNGEWEEDFSVAALIIYHFILLASPQQQVVFQTCLLAEACNPTHRGRVVWLGDEGADGVVLRPGV
jgi:hypothetical protein